MNGERVDGFSTSALQTMDLAQSPMYFAGLPKSFKTVRYMTNPLFIHDAIYDC